MQSGTPKERGNDLIELGSWVPGHFV